MKRERMLQLLDLIDEFNQKIYAAASIEYGKYCNHIHITLFYPGKCSSVSFYNDDNPEVPEEFINSDDENFTKAEAYMRMLMKSADFCDQIRGDKYVRS